MVRSLKDQLAGTWRLVSLETRRADGEVTQPFGSRPIGFFVFEAAGSYSVQLADRDRPAGYVASLGTYEVDEDQQLFTLTATAGSDPRGVGVPTVRRVTTDGPVAVFQPPPQVIDGLGAQTRITWEKISGG
jgi:Lipocalin-like domain